MYKNKKFFVLGMARSGLEVSKLLACENEVIATDLKELSDENKELIDSIGVKFERLDNPEEYLDESFDYLIKTPGIKYTHPCVVRARELNIPVVNEVEIAYSYIDPSVNIIGITGSNGKTTTTTMTYEILKSAYPEKTHLAGNIGIPLSAMIKDIKPNDILVAEISDHQLCDMYNFKTNVSVVTNISECHIDFHDSYDRYKEMKKRIFNNLTDNDLVVINKDNEEAVNISNDVTQPKVYFSKTEETKCYLKDGKIYYDGECVVDTANFVIKGDHNAENAMAAIIAAKRYNVSNEVIQNVLYNFKGVEHRLEFVDNINGRKAYNDSKSTNCESTKIALSSFNVPTVLLLGGLDRGHSFDELLPFMTYVKHVVCYGETKLRIKEFCDNNNIPCTVVDELVEATNKAYEVSSEGDVILLSPACASWDQFAKFEDRGDLFKNTIRELGK